MNILLLNNNPVVNKLVTLSAQKTSDNLDLAHVVDDIANGSYDLLVIDDTLYEEGILAQVQEKTSYKKSLLICSRDMDEVPDFDETLKKPFLPTDLVELFSSVAKEVESMKDVTPDEAVEEMLILDDFGEDIDLSSPSILDDDDAQEVKELLDETSDAFEDFDDELNLDNIDLDDDLELEDSLDLEGLETPELEEASVLEESLDSLEETAPEEIEEEISLDEITDLELEDSLDLESEAMPELEDSLELVMEEDPEIEEPAELEESLESLDEDEEITLDSMPDLELEDSLDLENETISEMEESLELETEETPELEESLELEDTALDIEDQIKTAVSELSPEDLEEEVSEETLLEIAETEINSFDTLNSKDLKLAIGEEVEEEEEEEETEEIVEEIEESVIPQETPSLEETNADNGVESLKNLLQALTDKNVAASLQGMKISINITLGDNS